MLASSEHNVNRLEGLRTYLAGPLDLAKPKDLLWRSEITPWLQSLGLIVLDPTNKPINICDEDIENQIYKQELKDSNDFEKLSYMMKQIIRCDLRLCDMADFLIVYITLNVFTTGTIHEIVTMSHQRKPILIFCKQGINKIPNWLFGLCNYKEFFDSWLDLKEYLFLINSEAIIPNDKWLFFNKENLLCK